MKEGNKTSYARLGELRGLRVKERNQRSNVRLGNDELRSVKGDNQPKERSGTYLHQL